MSEDGRNPFTRVVGWIGGVTAVVAAFGLLLKAVQDNVPFARGACLSIGLCSAAPGKSANKITTCDRLAQPPVAAFGSVPSLVPGLWQIEMDAPASLAACRASVAEYPDEPRFHAYLGRALEQLKRLPEAAAAYKEAADKGNAVGHHQLGVLLLEGEGVTKNIPEAVRHFRFAIDKGFAASQFALGVHLLENGSPADRPEGVKLMMAAAAQGHRLAQGSLGYLYEVGEGVPRNQAEARRWYQAAAEQGDLYSQANLANLLLYMQGSPSFDTEAVRWARSAADQNYPKGLYVLGLIHERGSGMPRNLDEAVRHYRRAAAAGDEEAVKALKRLRR